jgi:predicted XRE-type DNA-binding protein
MANQKAARPIARGTKNVFADLGFPDAAERQVKLRLAHRVVQLLDRRKISQSEAAVALAVSLAGIKALRAYKLGASSIERLIGLLTALGDDVEIIVRHRPRSRRTGTISAGAPSLERSHRMTRSRGNLDVPPLRVPSRSWGRVASSEAHL